MAPSVLFELATEVFRPAISVPLDKGVQAANTGVPLLDWLPIVTMIPCLQTLQLYWTRRRYTDFAMFSVGFLLALIYHYAHMHPEGLANAHLLGLPGPAWRGLDILMAQALLARTLGHAIGASTPLVTGLANHVFPAALLIYAHLVADGVLTLGIASKVLVTIMALTVAAKATVEGWDTLPQYCPRRGKLTLLCFVVGFAVFPLPEVFPRHYWLFHSLWHVFISIGYNQLYLQLEGAHLADRQAQQAQQQEEQAGDSQDDSEGEGQDQAAATGWVAELLKPAQRLLRYQRQMDRQMAGEQEEAAEAAAAAAEELRQRRRLLRWRLAGRKAAPAAAM